MNVDVVTTRTGLLGLRDEWQRLLRYSPMQSSDWLLTWWDAYGEASRELCVVTVRESGRLLGLAPWYAEWKGAARHLRWLGDGLVCSDHATILAQPMHVEQVVDAITEWILAASADQWSQMTLESVDDDDVATGRLLAGLAAHCYPISYRSEPGSCCVSLPETWNAFLASISKNHRKRCRRWDRQFFVTRRASVQVASRAEETLTAFRRLVEMHCHRRAALGQQGAFADPVFHAFHKAVTAGLAQRDQLQLRVLWIDGEPVAAEYVLQEGTTQFAYQSGMSSRGESFSAGSISVMAMIRDAISSGYRRLDLLRGVEPYKFSWGAQHRPARTVLIRRPTARGRIGAWCDSARFRAKTLKQRVAVLH